MNCFLPELAGEQFNNTNFLEIYFIYLKGGITETERSSWLFHSPNGCNDQNLACQSQELLVSRVVIRSQIPGSSSAGLEVEQLSYKLRAIWEAFGATELSPIFWGRI